jgi:hypothetical protein
MILFQRGFFWVAQYWSFLKLNLYDFRVSRNIFSHWHDPASFTTYITLLHISAVAEGSIFLVLHLGLTKFLSQALISWHSEACNLRLWTLLYFPNWPAFWNNRRSLKIFTLISYLTLPTLHLRLNCHYYWSLLNWAFFCPWPVWVSWIFPFGTLLRTTF